MTRPRILLVEDEMIVGLNLKNKLTQQGYEIVDVVSTGEASVIVALDTKPDLILMDIRLKGKLDGIEAAALIRAELNVPVVFITAYIDDITKQRASAISNNYLYKPFDVAKLFSTIYEVTGM